MTAKIKIIYDDTDLKKGFNKFKDVFNKELFKGVNHALLVLQRQIIKNVSGPILKVKTGTLRRSWGASTAIKVLEEGLKVVGTIGSNLKYAAIHEFGGRITPSRANNLTIPVPENKSLKKPREYSNTYFKNGIMYEKISGKNSKRLFFLKREVTLPARRYVSTSGDQAREGMLRVMQLAINKATGVI
jgi:phage gpG-like protein